MREEEKTTVKAQTGRKVGASRTTIFIIAVIGAAIIFGLLLWMWANTRSGGTSKSSLTSGQSGTVQTNDSGEITTTVSWRGHAAGPVFSVEMGNHMVDLDGYNLQQLAVLRTDQGKEIHPINWNAPPGGHHRKGTLTFPAQFADGTPVIGPKTHKIELVIHNMGSVSERTFQWTL